jgi:aldose 1-epimerase
MRYQVRTTTRPAAGGRQDAVVVLEDREQGAAAEVWPAGGFNGYSWTGRTASGRRFDVLYAPPAFFEGARPTRGGIPVLFPFPNRIRDGRFTWDGTAYQLPLNDPAGKNAIHGFACRHPWRVLDQGAGADGAWVTGEFLGSRDAPDLRSLWPADYLLRLTYRLSAERLRIEAVVENPGRRPLPFGLGFHPYFRVPLLPDEGRAEECRVEAPAGEFWELHESLPTGVRRPVDAARDLRRPRPFGELQLDDVLTGLPGADAGVEIAPLCPRGTVYQAGAKLVLSQVASPDFRELVVFTPPHREAVCLEPYTCTTDAINLQQRGLDACWRVLPPGQTWSGVVELTLRESEPG